MGTTLYPELVEKVEGLGRRGQVLAGIWAGKGTKEIGAELGLSPKTVEYHRARLYRLFGVHDPVSLCRRAITVGLIDPESDPPKSDSGAARVRGPKERRKRLAEGRMPEAMAEAMPDACHSESESESESE